MARKKEHFQDIAVQGLYAAGSFGTAGQVLKSDGDNVYWTNETIGDATTLDGYDSTAFAILASANKFTQPITVNVNPLTTGPALPTGTLLHLIGTNATQSRMYLDTFGANAAFLGRRANGTNAAPSAILSGDFIFTFGGFGYGTTGYIASASALGLVTATENFTDTAAGAKFSFRTIANGTITPLVRWHIENDGSLIAEGLTVTGNGTVNAIDYFDNGVNINTIYADATNTLTMANKTLTNPTINAAALSGTFSGAVTRTGIETFNLNAAAAPAAFAGTIIHVVQADAANPRILLDGFGAQPTVTLRRASGTNASKTAILSGEAIGNVNGMGYGSSGYSANSRVALAFLAAENWTDSAQGTRIIFSTSTNTTASSSTRWGIENDGSFVYNGGSVTGNGTVNAIDYFDNGVNINTIYADATNTLTMANKTLTSPTINGGTITGTFSGTPTFSIVYATNKFQANGTYPAIEWYQTDGGVDEKYWRFIADGIAFDLQMVNDAYSTAASALKVTRSGLVATSLELYGVAVPTVSSTHTFTNKTLTNPTINAAALSGTFSGAVTRTGVETFNFNAAAPPTPPTVTLMHIVQADALAARIAFDTFGDTGNITFRRANGTNASKTALAVNNTIGNIIGFGYAATGYSATSRATVSWLAAENWTDTAQGTKFTFSLTTNGTTALAERWVMDHDGSFHASSVSVTGVGTVNAVDYFDNGVNINTIYASLGGSPSFSTITSTGMIYAVNGFSATSGNSFEPQLQLTNTNNDNTAGYLILNKNPADTTLATNDYLGTILFQGRGSSSIGQGVQIASTYRGTRGTNWVEANLQFGVTNSAGTMLWTYINSNGGITSDALGTVWGSLNDGAGTGLDADLLDGYDSLALAYGGRAQRLITGGGTIIVDASGYVLWTTRFIVISGGRGTTTATSGYFDINCPTSGTITGVGGAANVTATAAGIPLAAWQALYYILPLGSAETSLAANFRVVSYTSNVDIPEHWVLICTRNGDSTNIFYFNNGIQLGLSDTYTAGTVWNSANDGSGSGLDADTLDGLNSNAFVYRGIGHGDAQTILLNRGLSATSGISFYSAAFTAWSLYMASSGTASNGPNGTVTAPSGNGVTQWALRSFIENVAGYGWTFESGTSATTTPTVVAEIRSSDGRIWSSAQGVLWGATNDGPGSGLDADTIDTIESNRIIYGINQSGSTGANPTQTFTELAQYKSGFWDVNAAAWTPDTGYWWGLTMAHISNGPSYNFGGQIIIQNSGGTPNAYLRSISGGGTPAATAWQRIWTSAVDGSGSGLDADTVDGYQATNLGRLAVAQSWTAQQTFDYDGTTIFNDPTGDYILQFNTAGTARGYVGADATYSFSVRNTGGSRLLSAINNSGIVEAFSLDATNGSVRILLATAGLQHFDGAGNYRWLEGVRSDITGNVNDWTLYNSAGGETIRAFHSTRVVNFPVNITIAGGTNWHAGNDGAGSGLDADTLDGYNIGLSGGTIGLLNGNNTYSGISTHTAEIRWTSPPINSRMLGMPWAEMSSDAGGNGVFGNNLYANWDGVSVTYRTVNTHGSVGYGAIRFGYGATQVAAFGGATTADATVTPTWHTLWHSGSDGAGSGLDADLLDGLTSTQFLRSDIAQQGGIGYGTHDYNTYPSVYSVTFVNPTGSSNLPTGMGAVTAYRFIMAGGDTASRGVDIVATQENPYTNIFVRERTYGGWSKLWHNNNDGAGSGLDADLFDGVNSTEYVFGAGGGYGTTGSLTNMNTGAKSGFFTTDNPTNGPFATWTQWINVRGAFWADGSQYVQQIAWNMFSTDMRIRNCSNGTWGSWYQIWHSNSDGAGSGLDADLWDGNNFATYLDQALLTSSSPSFAGLTMTGLIVGKASTDTDVNTANDAGSFSCRGDGTTGKVASMSFHRTGNYAINMGLGADNIFRIGGWSASSNCLQLTGAGALTTLSTITAGGSIYAGSGHWFRSTGDTGWYSETWGGGTYMTDGTYVKIYNGKAFYVGNNIDATGNITAYYSDERLKTKSRNVENALDQISTLTPFFYFENELARSLGYNNQEEQIGISAQEVQRILPQVVHRAPVDIAVDENNNKYSKSGEEYLTVDYAKLVPLLIAAVKELKAEIEELRRDASR